jgi:hypothetical protein
MINFLIINDLKRNFQSRDYGRQIVETRQQGRIRRVYYDANVPVHTAWDLGYNDSTAI